MKTPLGPPHSVKSEVKQKSFKIDNLAELARKLLKLWETVTTCLSRVLQGCYKGVSWVFQKHVMGDLWLNLDLISWVVVYFELQRWSTSSIALNCKNYQNGNFWPKIVVFGHFEGVSQVNSTTVQNHIKLIHWDYINHISAKYCQAQPKPKPSWGPYSHSFGEPTPYTQPGIVDLPAYLKAIV